MSLDDLGRAPRWFLLILAGGFVVGVTMWVRHVEDHIRESNSGYQRISALEARVQSLEAHRAWCRVQHEAHGGK